MCTDDLHERLQGLAQNFVGIGIRKRRFFHDNHLIKPKVRTFKHSYFQIRRPVAPKQPKGCPPSAL